MLDFYNIYKEKLMLPQEIAEAIPDNSICCSSACLGQPVAITDAIGKYVASHNKHGLVHSQTMTVYPSAYVDPALADKYRSLSWFTTGHTRPSIQGGYGDVMPAYFRDHPALIEQYFPVNIFYASVSPMDSHGYFSFGPVAADLGAMLEKAKHIYLQVNPMMPRTFGPHIIHISQVDGICEASSPLSYAQPTVIDELSATIGGYIAQEIPNGATIQLGVGAIPDAVGIYLKDKQHLGIHTELFTESMVDLIACGAVDNSRKNIHRGKTITTMAYGSQRVYDFLNDNVSVEFHPVDYVNDPNTICKNDSAISINACIDVDLWGQVASESIGARYYSGTGGQVDFVRGSIQSKGGKSFIAMPSTTKDGQHSRIKPYLQPGTVVTTSKNDVDHIVTEYGIAKLRGKSMRQRANALIQIAHPNFRDQLTFDAKKMGVL